MVDLTYHWLFFLTAFPTHFALCLSGLIAFFIWLDNRNIRPFWNRQILFRPAVHWILPFLSTAKFFFLHGGTSLSREHSRQHNSITPTSSIAMWVPYIEFSHQRWAFDAVLTRNCYLPTSTRATRAGTYRRGKSASISNVVANAACSSSSWYAYEIRASNKLIKLQPMMNDEYQCIVR